jgi:hypothetical protein
MMKDIIFDVVRHTAGLGIIDAVKVTGTDEDTSISALDQNKTVILNAKLHNPAMDLVGEFGMGNLGFLNGLTNLYNRDGSTVDVAKVTKNGTEAPESLVFKDADGNTDKYRLMSKEVVDQELQTVKFKGAKWNISFEPTKAKVSDLAQAAGIYSSIEPTFTVKVENGNVVFVLGSDSGGSHFGKRVFATGVEGTIRDGIGFPLTQFLNIMKLGMSGTCTVNFSDQGACMISIDSGLGLYNYILPSLTR